MKILCVSDKVSQILYSSSVREQYPDLDLIIGCGDLPFYYLEFLISALDIPLIYVKGNHDKTPQYTSDGRELHKVQGGRNLHGQVVTINGTIFAGLEGSMRYRANAPLMYSENEMRAEMLPMFPKLLWNRIRHGRALDVLITHSPVFGIHDRPDRAHTGFKIFRTFIRLFKPRYMLHGHIHKYGTDTQTESQLHGTTIINVYPRYILNVG